MSALNVRLAKIVSEWQRWADSAQQSEDGWQSGFPAWTELMDVAAAAMCQAPLDEETFRLIEFCWKISEEDETMADCGRACGGPCVSAVERLARSANPAVRWQAFDVIGSFASPNVGLLVDGLDDCDSYCRRRALLALSRADCSEAKKTAGRFIDDEDPQMRRIARELIGERR